MNNFINSYDIDEHKHRFATWCGATAGSRSKICRFSVKKGKEILEKSGIHPKKKLRDLIHITSSEFNSWHNEICESMTSIPTELNNFSYGIAAKILNCYLKAYIDPSIDTYNIIHPPVDRILLQELSSRNIGKFKKTWTELLHIGWSKFKKENYATCISHIRMTLPPQTPLWKIEYFWKGYQENNR